MDDFIPTRVSKIKENAVKEFVSVSYEKPRKKKQRVDKIEDENTAENATGENKGKTDVDRRRQQELEMKRIRYEVMKFGMSGFEKAQAKEANVALAISLGAKPPKNKGINYKLLKEQKKMEMESAKNQQHASGLEKSLMKHNAKKTRRKDANDILGVYGKVNKKPVVKSRK